MIGLEFWIKLEAKGKENMSAIFPEGSVWRRWDLHIHAPGTSMGDLFGSDSLEEYLKALEGANQLAAVLGVTDYCSIRTYKILLGKKRQGRLPDVQLLLPNVEFRVTPETKRSKGVNVHVLISPEDPEHVQRVEEALSKLEFPHHDDISCSYNGLVRLGRSHDPAQTDEWGQYRTGVEQFKPAFDTFKDWYNTQSWLRNNSLVGVSTGEDGLGGLSHDGGLAAIRDQIKRFAHFLFSSKQSDRAYWLGEGVDSLQTLREKYGGPKPCLCGSDAHSLNDITEPIERRYCWVKADPTFEGLRQVLYEPRGRVWVGPTPPSRHDEDQVIQALTISSSRGWFEDTSITLNPGLVAVIGSRGSGKTALSDLIAYAAGAQVDEQDSFLARAQDKLYGSCLELNWASGRSDPAKVTGTEPSQEYSGVKYLSQKFVENLCSGDRQGEQLRREIETVVFGSLGEEQRLGCERFQDLIQTRTAALRDEAESIDTEVRDLNQRIAEIDERISHRRRLEKDADKQQQQILEKKRQLPKIDQEKDKKTVEKLTKLNDLQQSLKKQLSEVTQRNQRLSDLAAKVDRFGERMDRFWVDFLEVLADAGIPAEGFEQSKPQFPVDPMLLLNQHIHKTKKEIRRLQGHQEPAAASDSVQHAETLTSLSEEIKMTEKQLSIDEQKRKRLLTLNEEIAELGRKLKATQERVRTIKEELPQRRKAYADRRTDRYLRYFSVLNLEKVILEELYAPLQQRLAGSEEHEERQLELYIKREVDLDSWVDHGDSLFDRRKIFKSAGELREFARRHLHDAWRTGDGDAAVDGIGKIIKEIQDQVGTRRSEILDVLITDNNLVDVADWLFSINHIRLHYDIRYDGTELEKLSPGTKGIVLLELFLALDTNDSRPLLIDQPEENLDNQSIYDLLIGYFRAARERRQVILITHNPNLVVNTDADQIVVAHCERRDDGLPHIVYRAGALEATEIEERLGGSIRDSIVNILEGGEEAFRMRERKLGFIPTRP